MVIVDEVSDQQKCQPKAPNPISPRNRLERFPARNKVSNRAPRYPEANQGGHRLALRQEMVELQRISLQNIQPSSKLNVYRLSGVPRAKQPYISQRECCRVKRPGFSQVSKCKLDTSEGNCSKPGISNCV